MNKIAFTICAKNYIGLAQALQSSVEKYNKDVLFLIFVVDEFSIDEQALMPENILIAKDNLDIPLDQWYEMAFKYDLTEFCTSIKPSCFKYLFKKYNETNCIYFDPDILTYSSLNEIYNELNHFSIILTPHITTIEKDYSGKLNERNLLYSGMFNLGFIAFKNDEISKIVLDWWEVRLKDRCYQNMMENYFTDQKWIDFLPSFFPNDILISKNLGLNLAPWNFYERELFKNIDTFYVRNRLNDSTNSFSLVFIHFSGFDYRALLENKVQQGNIKELELPNDLKVPFEIYTNVLRETNISKFINLKYTYNTFSNLSSISNIHRKLFRRLLEDGKVDFNPFSSDSWFYKSLLSNRLISNIIVSNEKKNISNIENAESITLKINLFLRLLFKLIGAQRFFLLVRLMRLYSKPENHIYLIDKNYLKKFKIWN